MVSLETSISTRRPCWRAHLRSIVPECIRAEVLARSRHAAIHPACRSRRPGVDRASAGAQTAHPRLRAEDPGVNRQAHAAGRADRTDRDPGDRTPSRLCRAHSSADITVRLLFCTDRGDPVDLLDRATWVPYYLLTAKIIRPAAVDLSKARVEVCVATRSLSPHR